MNLTGGLRGFCALLNRPGPALVGTGGEEGDEAQQGVAGLNQPVEAAFRHAQLLHEHGLLLRVIQLGDVRLQLGADGQALAALGIGKGLDCLIMAVVFRLIDLIFRHVCHINRLFQGQQVGGGDEGQVVSIVGVGSGQLALVQVLQQAGEHLHLPGEFLVAALHGLLSLVNAALHHLDVRHDQLQIDDVDVPQGVGGAFHMGHVAVLKTADNVDDGVGGADVAQELVAQTLALACALHETGNVHELDDGGSDLLGVVKLRQPVKALVRHAHHAHVGVDGAEGVVVRGNPRVGDGVKQGGLAHVGQSHDT